MSDCFNKSLSIVRRIALRTSGLSSGAFVIFMQSRSKFALLRLTCSMAEPVDCVVRLASFETCTAGPSTAGSTAKFQAT